MVYDSREEFLKIAQLIKIDFSDKEIDETLSSMKQVFGWVEGIVDIEISGGDINRYSIWHDILAKLQGGDLREDIVNEEDSDNVLLSTLNLEYNYFKVPKVLKG